MQKIVETDSKGRVNLGRKFASKRFIVEEKGGELILRRAVVIPERELWIHQNEEAKAALLSGLSDAKDGSLHRETVELS